MIKMAPCDEARGHYRLLQENLRETKIATDEELIREVAYDIRVIDTLKNNNEINLDQSEFLSSTTYLIEEYPEFYQRNPDFIEK